MYNQKLVYFLNQLLANNFVMFMKLHRYRWYIKGQHVFQLQEIFTEMQTMFAKKLDILAERILAIDGQPYATMVKCVKEATLTEANADDLEDEIIAQLIHDYEQIISEIRAEGLLIAKDIGDEPTVDLFINFQAQLERYIWMLKSYQAK